MYSWHSGTMRISCETQSAHVEETPMGKAKWRVTMLGASSGGGAFHRAWCIMAATVQGQCLPSQLGPIMRLSKQSERTEVHVSV
jgi:hypothetical protein